VTTVVTSALDMLEQRLPVFTIGLAAVGGLVFAAFLFAYLAIGSDPGARSVLFYVMLASALSLVTAGWLGASHFLIFVGRRVLSGQRWRDAKTHYYGKYGSLDRWLGGLGGSL
jgi:hypothetical protein